MKEMKGLLLIVLWVMIGYALHHFLGFWGVFGEIMFIVFVNLITWERQIKDYEKWKEDNKL